MLLAVDGRDVRLLPVTMGNPHVVTVVDDPADAPVTTLGPRIEHHPGFRDRTNVEFVAVRDDRTLDLRVWERGVGETMACGTGVCGAVAAMTAIGSLAAGQPITVHVPGGVLLVRWEGGPDDPVHLAGPAVEVAAVTPSGALLAAAGLAEAVRA